MYDEAPLPSGKPYLKGDWESYAIHDDTQIFGFFGEYRWLSNFEQSLVWYRGRTYPSTECAYQAAKVRSEYREAFRSMTPAQAKKASRGRDLTEMVRDWDSREKKIQVMREVTFSKYLLSISLRRKLLGTDGKKLVEANHWKDSTWGFCVHENHGENLLGKIIMDTRAYWLHGGTPR